MLVRSYLGGAQGPEDSGQGAIFKRLAVGGGAGKTSGVGAFGIVGGAKRTHLGSLMLSGREFCERDDSWCAVSLERYIGGN